MEVASSKSVDTQLEYNVVHSRWMKYIEVCPADIRT